MESLNKTEALNGNKSAIIESGLQDLLNEFKGCTGNTKEITTPHIKSGTLGLLLTYLDKKKTNAKTENEATSISIVDINTDDGTKTVNNLTLKRLRAMWENPNFKLAQHFGEIKSFIIQMRAATLKYENLVAEHRIEKMEKFDKATEALYGIDIKRLSIQLGQSLLPPGINDADKEFTYDNLRINSGELYWVNTVGKLSPIFVDEKSGAISKGCEFLEEWDSFAYPFIQKYQADVIKQAEALYKGTPIENGLPTDSFDTILAGRIPRIILQNLDLIVKARKDNSAENSDNKTYIPDGFEVSIHEPSNVQSMSLEKWRNIYTNQLCKYVKKSYVTPVKQFSNTKGAGITYFSLDGINTNGNKSITRPQLPPNWNALIFGKNGDRSLFACDAEMSLLRLAYFVSNLVLEDSYSRQILFCAGGGNDGKTTLCSTLSALLGNENAVSLNPAQLDNDGNRIGLINKSFVYMPDVGQPSKILDNSIVKQLTGRDPMAMRKLYCSPFTYTPEHCFVAVTTNKTIYAKGIHQTSRILPLTFQINYTADQQKSPTVLQSELLSERTEFLQWCFDMLRFYKERKNANGQTLALITGNSLRLLTDERYNEWLNGHLEMNKSDDIALERKTQLNMELEALNNGPGRFVALCEEDSEETDDELFGRLFGQTFEKDPNGFVSKADLQMYIMENEKDLLVKALGFKTANLSYCNRYRLFLKYVRSAEGVEETNTRCDKTMTRGFKGIKLKDGCNDNSYIQSQTEDDTLF